MTLHKARILSSENDASVKQEQNVNIKIAANRPPPVQPVAYTEGDYPQVPQMQPQVQPQMGYTEGGYPQNGTQNANFTTPSTTGAYPSVAPINNPPLERSIELDGEDLDTKNKFLEILLSIYETNPLRMNNYLVCHSNTLMELIKILTKADKVELVINEDSGCTGCVSNSKYMKIDKILVSKNGVSNELKYGYNHVWTELIRHSISLKICI